MGFIPEDKIKEVRDRTSIVSVISQYLPLKKTGVNYKTNCPFHGEKTASFVVSESKKIYHCFGCGKGGNVFTFLMEHRGLSFPEIVRKLADDIGIVIPDEIPVYTNNLKNKKELFYKINKFSLSFFRNELKKNKKAQEYLVQRGIKEKMIDLFYLGYAPTDWSGLSGYLKSKGFFENDLVEAGVILKKDRTSSTYDRFRDRIMFPLIDLHQHILGFGGRSFSDDIQPKYLNSSESAIYQKGQELYGLFTALYGSGKKGERENRLSFIRDNGIILVEGYMDCIQLVQAGFVNVAATMGTALTEHHVSLLKRFTERIYLLFDGDEAGKQASERSLPLLLKEGFFPKIVELPDQLDPDDFVRRQNGFQLLQNRMKEAKSLLDFVIERLILRHGLDIPGKAKIIEWVTPVIAGLSQDVFRMEVIKKISDRLQIEEKWLLKSLNFPTLQTVSSQFQQELRDNKPSIELEVLEYAVLFPNWLDLMKDEKILDFFSDSEVKTIGLEMMSQYQQMRALDFPALVEKIKSQVIKKNFVQGILKKENQVLSAPAGEQVFHDCIKRVRRNYLENVEKKILHEIKICEGDPEKESKKVSLLNQYQEIVKQKNSFNH